MDNVNAEGRQWRWSRRNDTHGLGQQKVRTWALANRNLRRQDLAHPGFPITLLDCLDWLTEVSTTAVRISKIREA